MPIEVKTDIRRSTADEFEAMAYEVMACAFDVHNDVGKFLDEKIYKRIVAERLQDIELEVPVVVSFGDFSKSYFLDMLFRGAGLFEWKAVQKLAPPHRAQLLNYLFLTDLPKGKLVNVSPSTVEHEFVNSNFRPEIRRRFNIDENEFLPLGESGLDWKEKFKAVLADLGTGLDLNLYTELIVHFQGGLDRVMQNVAIIVDDVEVGKQAMRLTNSGASFKVTTLTNNLSDFERHARRFLKQTTLPAIHWLNIVNNSVQIKTITPT